jgi:hypothetical protein
MTTSKTIQDSTNRLLTTKGPLEIIELGMPKRWDQLEDFERVLNFMYALEGGNSNSPMTAFQLVTGWPSKRVRAAFAECVSDEKEMRKQFRALAQVRDILSDQSD